MKKAGYIWMLMLWSVAAFAQPGTAQLKRWQDERFNMFIHWGGIYSVLGSVWDGKPVTRGLGEQIQAHAGIYSDSYANVAHQFNPVKWNADSVVMLAKHAGMRAIVFTSKHHDGFCMWDTKTTDFNVVKATPYKKDVVKELSEACRRHGIKFGLYFSNIDWHLPEGSPISSHNSDSIPPRHHQYNLAQVRELLSNYGEISELWFDMGSNTLEQSREMRALVHELQPDCMVGSRLGNDMGDFTVTSDNHQPDYEIGVPWQSPASFFDETWGYRSWQKRVPADEKYREKLTSLIHVAGRGGKYLLNIGPKGDGEVVPYEKDILLRMGKWLEVNREAIYGTAPDPFRETFAWGTVTSTPNKIYLILLQQPENNVIRLPRIQGQAIAAAVLGEPGAKPKVEKGKEQWTVRLPKGFSAAEEFKVVALTFAKGYTITPAHLIQVADQPLRLNHKNSFKAFSNSGIDYNSRFNSTIKETWNLVAEKRKVLKPVLWYSDQEAGRQLSLVVAGKETVIDLKDGKEEPIGQKDANIQWGSLYVAGPFEEGIEEVGGYKGLVDVTKLWRGKPWTENQHKSKIVLEADRRNCYYFEQQVTADKETDVLVKVTSGDGIALALNGDNILLHNNEKRGGEKSDIVLLHLAKGINQLIIKSNNMFQQQVIFQLDKDIPQRLYQKELSSWDVHKGGIYEISWSLYHPTTIHETMNMPNISLHVPL